MRGYGGSGRGFKQVRWFVDFKFGFRDWGAEFTILGFCVENTLHLSPTTYGKTIIIIIIIIIITASKESSQPPLALPLLLPLPPPPPLPPLVQLQSVFSGPPCQQLRDSAQLLLKRLAKTARDTLSEFEEAVEKDASKAPVADGAVHPLTSYVINYIKFLFE